MSSTSAPVAVGFAGQLIAGAGAVLVLLASFGPGFEYAGVAVLVLGVVVSAPDAGAPGPHLSDWWTVLALGSLACLIGVVLGLLLPVPGAIILSAGAIAALVAVGLGSPVAPE
ncbi:MAG: hypothetical protein JJE10_00330 [Thermoleophilia bacterium]|nr:hypothetical protein [Thermoleophilia bacterium]